MYLHRKVILVSEPIKFILMCCLWMSLALVVATYLEFRDIHGNNRTRPKAIKLVLLLDGVATGAAGVISLATNVPFQFALAIATLIAWGGAAMSNSGF